MRTTYEVYKINCDRCKVEFKLENGAFIENLSYSYGGYSSRGDGGAHYTGGDLCKNCTEDFMKFWNNNAD